MACQVACFGLSVRLWQALHALHEQGRAHVDLKPANIHVSNWQDVDLLNVTVLDLGSSELQDSGITLSNQGCAAIAFNEAGGSAVPARLHAT